MLDFTSNPDISSWKQAIQAIWDKNFPSVRYLYRRGISESGLTWTYYKQKSDYSVSFMDDCIYFSVTNNNYAGAGVGVYHNEPIDMSPYSKLYIGYEVLGGKSYDPKFGYQYSGDLPKANWGTYNAISYECSVGLHIAKITINAPPEPCRALFHSAVSNSNNVNGTYTCKVYEIWLEL